MGFYTERLSSFYQKLIFFNYFYELCGRLTLYIQKTKKKAVIKMRARFTVGKNIKTKLLFPSVALIFVICIIFSLSSLNSLRGAITDLGISQGKLAAKAVTDAINPADISKVTISHQNKQAINRIRASLDRVSANNDIKSAYTIIKKMTNLFIK